ncbi:hypothetical protein PSECIP111951_02167 [Pseudoalteromonas holothuriae]|uniref:Uncharacterized protein n=1 Tax=Pseudoalteromonas holothuriae TaxID=2963714 RepID=A0ABN8UP24_9GAMM|nr:hypothetical protein [Pseudoalteromonas sp. CIP111951]CAH9059924.1 hypothetical protein PSECIP111951_02167 [Pseudoalteromonas sp. CIP111951]
MKRLILILISIFAPSFSFAMNGCEQILYVGYGFSNPLAKSNPIYPIALEDLYILPRVDDDEHMNESLKILEEQGIEEYVVQSLDGKVLGTLDYFGKNINVLDVALANNAQWETINRIVKAGYEPTYTGWMFAITNLTDQSLVSFILLFPSRFTELNYREVKYNKLNLLIKERKFNVLDKLNDLGFLNKDYFYNGELVDLEPFSILDRSKLAKYINLNKYMGLFEENKEISIKVEKEKSDFVSHISPFQLVALCKEGNKIILKSAFTIQEENFRERLKKLGVDENVGVDEFNKLVNSPLYQDYFSYIKEAKNFQDYKVNHLDDFFSIDNVVALYKRNKKEVFIDLSGLSMHEYAYFNGIKWANIKDVSFRLDVFARHFVEYSSSGLKARLVNDNKFKSLFYHGKNFSYYAAIFIEDSKELEWIFNNLGRPSATYGYNLSEKLYNLGCYSNLKNARNGPINRLKSLGVNIDDSVVHASVLAEYEKCRVFKEDNKKAKN